MAEGSKVRLTILGSGTSHGVPMIACACDVCTSEHPHDKRMRASVLVEMGGVNLLVDTAPELRLQCIANGVQRVDAVLYTHHHADHIFGLDDLRIFNEMYDMYIDVYGTQKTIDYLEKTFHYVFDPNANYPSFKPMLNLHAVERENILIHGQSILPVPLMHGPLPMLGYRFGNIAYCTDCNVIPDESWELLEGLDVLILDGLRRRPHPTHFNLKQAVEVAKRVGAKQTYFTHIAHELMHEEVCRELPECMSLAYDGLVVKSNV